MDIELDFGTFICKASLFDTKIAKRFSESLPCKVSLTKWGDELYGSIGKDLGKEKPVPNIPPGGIAYTHQGNYVCVFFGQTPAWPVEYIGQLRDDDLKLIAENPAQKSVEIRINEPW